MHELLKISYKVHAMLRYFSWWEGKYSDFFLRKCQPNEKQFFTLKYDLIDAKYQNDDKILKIYIIYNTPPLSRLK